ncbi:MAG: amidase, partial [Planctomycetota bacterium]
LRLGIYRPWFEDADPAVVTACRSLCERLEDAGARLVEIEIPEIGLVQPVQAATITAEMATAVMKIPAALRSRFGLDVRLLLALAEGLSANDYVHAQRLRHRICGHFLEAFAEVDVIVTPSTASTAPPVPPDALTTGESNFDVIDRMMRFAPAANLTGHPAISIPAGYDEAGLPIGLQAIAPPWQEARLLRLAVAAERLVERRRPAVHYRLLD